MLRDKIEQELTISATETPSESDACRQSVLRLILAAVRDRDAALRESGSDEAIPDSAIEAMMHTMIKQREAAAQDHEESGRIDDAVRERNEIAVLSSLLPQCCDADELDSVSRAVIEEIGAHGIKDLGRTMDALKQRLGARMDFQKASAVVRGLLL